MGAIAQLNDAGSKKEEKVFEIARIDVAKGANWVDKQGSSILTKNKMFVTLFELLSINTHWRPAYLVMPLLSWEF